MGFKLTSADYADYIQKAYDLIHANGDYVTELDSATGDGDHWSNINMGFEALVAKKEALAGMNISDELKEIGKTMMAVIGGSSGVLYGSAYLAAAKVVKDKDGLDATSLCDVLEAMLDAIISRGQAQEGFKTMIDALAPAVHKYRECLASGMDEAAMCDAVAKASIDGAESTKDMEAVRGRATYQANKGVGHLDPGAITMSYQISTLMECAKAKI